MWRGSGMRDRHAPGCKVSQSAPAAQHPSQAALLPGALSVFFLTLPTTTRPSWSLYPPLPVSPNLPSTARSAFPLTAVSLSAFSALSSPSPTTNQAVLHWPSHLPSTARSAFSLTAVLPSAFSALLSDTSTTRGTPSASKNTSRLPLGCNSPTACKERAVQQQEVNQRLYATTCQPEGRLSLCLWLGYSAFAADVQTMKGNASTSTD